MIMLGSTFLCGDIMSIPCTPTNIDNIDYIKIENAEYDALYVTENTSFELTEELPEEWDFDTILYAKFDGNTLAGNVDWSLETVSNVLIKRRKSDEFTWITLSNTVINSVDDFDISGVDVTCEFAEYQYAVVPILNGIEGNYSYTTVEVHADCMLIADDGETWVTTLTDGFCDNVSNVPSSTIVTMYDKYPTIIRNSNACYETISVSAGFLELNKEKCEFIIDDARRLKNIKKCKEFLNNGKPKFLRNIDGRIWLVYITTPPTDSADGYYKNRRLDFECTEIGDPTLEPDLYYAGLITATEEWWNR